VGRKSQQEMRRQQIVRAFALVLAQHGYAGATMVAVAERAGFAPGLLHHHFRNKQEILDELLAQLIAKFRHSFELRCSEGEPDLEAYIDAALKLDQRADSVAAKCWVSIMAEALREPALFDRVRAHLNRELRLVQSLSHGRMDNKESGALIAFILGALVFGAFAPRQASGFAADSAKLLMHSLQKSKK
jgi:TetR/AcrR family transcriptional repressor of bet genes